MDTEVKVALITTLGAIVLALIPMAMQFWRDRGVKISAGQEALIRDIAVESAQYVEELVRGGATMTSEEKIGRAVAHARKLLDKHASVPTPGPDEMRTRIEAMLVTALPGHGGQPTTAVAEVPAPDPQSDR